MAEPFSVCMVTTFYPPHHFGGDAIYTERLAQALARRGHDVTVVYSADAYRALGGDRGDAPPAETGITLHPLERRLPRTASLAAYLTGRPAFYGNELAEVLSRNAFDVVHFHNISLVGGPGILRYGDGIKVYTTHEH
jgi:glycosyltransferase involved in cell wall biosynthesis